jgi:dihydrodipicolinate synthase/N-acetylneuraminate lyase
MDTHNTQSYFIVTIPDSDKVQRPCGTGSTVNQTIEILDEAKKAGYYIHLVHVSYYIQKSERRNNELDFEWVENAEEWWAKQQ